MIAELAYRVDRHVAEADVRESTGSSRAGCARGRSRPGRRPTEQPFECTRSPFDDVPRANVDGVPALRAGRDVEPPPSRARPRCVRPTSAAGYRRRAPDDPREVVGEHLRPALRIVGRGSRTAAASNQRTTREDPGAHSADSSSCSLRSRIRVEAHREASDRAAARALVRDRGNTMEAVDIRRGRR